MTVTVPPPPYWAVIFSAPSRQQGYVETSECMLRLAAIQPGYLGAERRNDEHGQRVSVCYWDNVAAIAAWRSRAEQLAGQRLGGEWPAAFSFTVHRVERDPACREGSPA